MEFVIEDSLFFKKCVDAIASLVDEGTFEVSQDGLTLRTMDPSQIAMVDFVLPKSAFSSLNVEEKISLGVNLADLSKILARSRPEEKLTVHLEEKESRLVLEFVGHSKRHFRLPLLDSGAFPKEPKISFDAVAKIRGGAFKDMLRDAGLFSSHVVLQADDSEFVVEARGDSGDSNVLTKKDSQNMVELKVSSKSRAMFPFEYLDDMTRACPDESTVSVELKTDAPVRVSYEIGQAKLAFYLAPRVDRA